MSKVRSKYRSHPGGPSRDVRDGMKSDGRQGLNPEQGHSTTPLHANSNVEVYSATLSDPLDCGEDDITVNIHAGGDWGDRSYVLHYPSRELMILGRHKDAGGSKGMRGEPVEREEAVKVLKALKAFVKEKDGLALTSGDMFPAEKIPEEIYSPSGS